MTAALERYADRGVFRGFRASPEARGRVTYDFFWLTRRPMRAVMDRRGVLTFPALLPAPARAIVGAMVRNGGLSLSIEIRGANQQYAVSKALNLVNDMFVALHETDPDYLVEHFGISQE